MFTCMLAVYARSINYFEVVCWIDDELYHCTLGRSESSSLSIEKIFSIVHFINSTGS